MKIFKRRYIMAGFMMATMAVDENEKFKQHNNIQQQNEATINVNQRKIFSFFFFGTLTYILYNLIHFNSHAFFWKRAHNFF